MTKNLDAVSAEVLQERLLEEISRQKKLHVELKLALESEQSLRLENEILWVYLQRNYPGRVVDTKGLLDSLLEGQDLAVEIRKHTEKTPKNNVAIHKRIRRKIGTLPGVSQIYHKLKGLIR